MPWNKSACKICIIEKSEKDVSKEKARVHCLIYLAKLGYIEAPVVYPPLFSASPPKKSKCF